MVDRGPGAGVAGADRLSGLGDVLVVTVRKSFWASSDAELWPRRLYAHVYLGRSGALVNAVPVFVRALLSIWLRPPRIVLLGSVERTVPWFIRARRLGLLRGAKLVVTNQLNLTPAQLEQVDSVIVYASAQAAALGAKGVFLPLPADGDFEAARRAVEPGEYVFSGGGAGRDFGTLVEAVRNTAVRVEIVTFCPHSVAAPPDNVRVRGPLPAAEFVERMAGALAVVIPLESAETPHGQTTLVQALVLGKPVVATRSVGVVDYVDGEAGTLVEAGDAAELRRALVGVVEDSGLRERLAARARARSVTLTYAHHAEGLAAVCRGPA
jgi:glycosyltransferase involved in cell wall biosynthesis